MNEDSKNTRKSLAGRILRLSLKGLAGLFIVIVLVVAGVLVWLRTESAADFISRTATGQLESLGLGLRMGPMGGTLPGSLVLSDIELSDKHGVFLRASGLRFEARLLSLFKGRLEVADISLDRPEVIRLPDLPPSEQPEEEEEESTGGMPALPFGIRIDRIALDNGLLHAAVLAPDAKSEAVYKVDISGAASLEGSSLAAGLKLDFLNADGTGLALQLDLDAASGLAGLHAQSGQNDAPPAAAEQAAARNGEDSLSLSLVMRENEKGLLSLLMNDPALPPYVLSLNGKGPVRNWKADLALLLGSDAPVAEAASGPLPGGERKAEVIALASQLGLSCHSGSLWKDLLEKQNFVLTLDNTLIPGPKTPEALLPVLGERVKASLGLASTETGYGIRLDADSQAWKISIDQAHAGPAGSGASAAAWEDADGKKRDKGFAISGMLKATVTDPAALLRSGKNTSATPPPPLDSLSLTSSLSALVDGDFNGLEADGTLMAGGVGMTAPDGPSTGQTALAREDFSADYKIIARLTGTRANLDTFNLLGLGITVNAKATADIATQAVQAEAKVVAADNSPWQDLLGRLSGFAARNGSAPFGGYITLALDLSLPPKPGTAQGTAESGDTPLAQSLPVAGNLRLDAANMRWPTAQLEKIIGPGISAQAKIGGGLTDEPYQLELDEFRAGILSASGKASLLPPTPGQAGKRLPEPGMLQAAFTADISDLAPLAATGDGPPPISGPLRAVINADGKLDALRLKLGVTSPAISAGGNAMRNVALLVNAETSLTEALVAALGDISLSLGQSPGGPVSLGSRWQVRMPQAPAGQPAPPVLAVVEGFRMQGAGLEMSADLKTTIGAGGFPAVQGTVKGAVKDWNRLAALAGAPLSGGPTDFSLNLSHNGRGQEARLNLVLAAFRMQEKGSPPSLSIRDVKAQLQASGLPDKLGIDLALDTGRGVAGPLRWKSGKGSVKGGDNNGNFSFVLEAQGGSRPSAAAPAAGKKSGRRGAGQSELLALQGAYNLSKMEVLVNTFALRQPKQRVGMELKKPLTVRLDKGIALQGLDLGFQPGGRLTADADIAPGKLNAKLKLDALPFSFFKMFTPATLPDGTLMAEANLQSSGGTPRGSLKILSRVSATQEVSGVVAAGAGGNGNAVFELLVNGNIATSPGPSAVAGSGVRSIPGLIWLTGTGSLGNSSKQADAREGKLNFQIPLRAGANGLPLPVGTAPMAVKLDWKGPIEYLWQAVPMADRYLSGNTLLDASVSGSMNAPKLLLTAYMAGGSFQDIPNGLLISGINLEARNTPEGDVRALVSARDKQSGNLAIEANLTGVMGKPGTKPALDVRGQLDQFSPLHRDDLSIFLSGVFGVKGPFDAMEVTSDISVTRGELMISSKMGGSVTTLDVVNKKRAGEAEEEEEVVASDGPKLNLRIRIPRYFFIRGMGVNSEWQGDLSIDGFASAPSLRGRLSPVRGSVDMLSQTFSIEEGEIRFTGGMSMNPALDLTLMNEGPNITAYIKVGGSAKKPKLTLESRPPLPHDEVLAMVLFGKRVSELSRFEAIQLANSLRELSGVGGSSLDVLTGVRKSFGLDMLRVGGGGGETQRGTSGQAGESNLGAPTSNGDANGDSTPTLEAGKYINDSIYVGVEQGMTQESTAVRVEVELFPSVTLQGKSTSESSEVGIGWKKDY